MTKKCTKCGEVKPLTEYHISKQDKKESKCKVCTAAYNKRRYESNLISMRRRNRESYYRNYYGMEPKEYHALYTKQQGRCAVCNTFNDLLRVDHCHITGLIRGLLCHNCNVGIGHLQDDPDIMRRASEYVHSVTNTIKWHSSGSRRYLRPN